MNRSVVINDSPKKVSINETDVVPIVSSENSDESQSIDLEEVKEMRTSESSPKIEELEDKVQSESIAKNESVKVESFDNYDFSPSNTKVIYSVQISAHKGNDKTLKFNKIDGVFSNYYDDNYKRYFSGVYDNENDARLHQKSLVNKGFKDCYIVRLKGNKKL